MLAACRVTVTLFTPNFTYSQQYFIEQRKVYGSRPVLKHQNSSTEARRDNAPPQNATRRNTRQRAHRNALMNTRGYVPNLKSISNGLCIGASEIMRPCKVGMVRRHSIPCSTSCRSGFESPSPSSKAQNNGEARSRTCACRGAQAKA